MPRPRPAASSTFSLLLALALAAAASAEGAGVTLPADTPSQIQECVRNNQRHTSSRAQVLFKTTDRMGVENENRATVHWKLFEDGAVRVHMAFSDPADIRGSAILMIEKKGRNDMFMYLPELKKVRRVTGRMVSGSLFGTDFSYEQIERAMGMAEEGEVERRADAIESARPVFVMSQKPNPKESQFAEVVSYIDQETCVPLRVDFFESAGELRKVLTADPSRVKQHGSAWIPHEMIMKDLRDETHTLLLMERFELDVEIPRKMFTQGQLAKGN